MCKELEHIRVLLQLCERSDLLFACFTWLPLHGNVRTSGGGAQIDAAEATSGHRVTVLVEGQNVQRLGEEGAVRRRDAIARWTMEKRHVRVRGQEVRVQ